VHLIGFDPPTLGFEKDRAIFAKKSPAKIVKNTLQIKYMVRPTRESSNHFFTILPSWNAFLRQIGMPGAQKAV
jgi:hypothetical protein